MRICHKNIINALVSGKPCRTHNAHVSDGVVTLHNTQVFNLNTGTIDNGGYNTKTTNALLRALQSYFAHSSEPDFAKGSFPRTVSLKF